MPTTEHGWPYPDPLDARSVPANVMALAEMSDAHAVMRATDSADRDARYFDLPAGQLVTTSQAPWFVWLKAAATNKWVTLHSDSGWVTAGFTYPYSGWDAGSYGQVRKIGEWVDVRFEVVRSGGDLVPANGNISPDESVCTIPFDFKPDSFPAPCILQTSVSSAFGQVYTAAQAAILSVDAGGPGIRNGDSVRFRTQYIKS